MNLKEEITKTKSRLDDIEVRTNNISDKALRKALLVSHNEILLRQKVVEIEHEFLKNGKDYTILKLYIENFNDLDYQYRCSLQDDISLILDRNVTTKDFVSRFYENGFLVIFKQANSDDIQTYLSLISKAIAGVLNHDRNIPRVSQSIIQRNRHLSMRDDFVEMVLNR